MPNPLKNFVKFVSEKVYKHLGENSGNMLLTTSVIGIMASSFAQSAAILLNNKYSTTQKTFMIPQELTEGLVTVLSMFLVTRPIQKFSSKIMKSGKILSKDLVAHLKEQNLLEGRGKAGFDVESQLKKIIENVEKSDKYINSLESERKQMIQKPLQMLDDFSVLSDTASAFATTGGAILSTAIISPFLRNAVASNCQKIAIKSMEEENRQAQQIKKPIENYSYSSIYKNYGIMKI